MVQMVVPGHLPQVCNTGACWSIFAMQAPNRTHVMITGITNLWLRYRLLQVGAP